MSRQSKPEKQSVPKKLSGWSRIVSDESGDYYVVPLELVKTFNRLALRADENWPPEWAKYVGGYSSCIKFKEWSSE